jgi:hypothetical protein
LAFNQCKGYKETENKPHFEIIHENFCKPLKMVKKKFRDFFRF